LAHIPIRTTEGLFLTVYFAIGDVHGCFEELTGLFSRIQRTIEEEFSHRSDVFIVFLGDYVDRGPNTKSVIDFLIGLDPDRHIILPGNHEEMMLDYLTADQDHLVRTSGVWFRNGGLETLASYAAGRSHPIFNPHTRYDLASLVSARALVSQDHKAFLQKLLDNRHPYLKDNIDQLFFVHAGIDPLKRLEEQSYQDFLWSRHPSLLDGSATWIEELLIISGHTPIGDHPLINTNRINVDTGVVYGGKLSAVLLVDGDAISVLQSSRNSV
jgi:serine/threonine protein phosphatase 1